MSKQRLRHLLIPKLYRVWCRPDKLPGDFDITRKPSECTCANCLTAYRRGVDGFSGGPRFRTSHANPSRKMRYYDA